MLDVNMIIANNTQAELKKKNKKQVVKTFPVCRTIEVRQTD